MRELVPTDSSPQPNNLGGDRQNKQVELAPKNGTMQLNRCVSPVLVTTWHNVAQNVLLEHLHLCHCYGSSCPSLLNTLSQERCIHQTEKYTHAANVARGPLHRFSPFSWMEIHFPDHGVTSISAWPPIHNDLPNRRSRAAIHFFLFSWL